MAVGGFEDKRPELCYEKIIEEGIYLAVPKSWVPDAEKRIDSTGVMYADETVLKGHKIIISSSSTSLFQNLKRLFARHDVDLNDYCMIMRDAGVALQLAGNGQVGACVIRSEDGVFTMQEADAENLVVCALWGETFHRELYLAWNSEAEPEKLEMIQCAKNAIHKYVFEKNQQGKH